MLKQKYLNALRYGNEELIDMSTRSLIRADSHTHFTINSNRYVDELKLYRYYKNKGTGSILCSLFPLVLANRDIDTAFMESQNFFRWMRKSLTVKERMGLYLLSLYIQRKKIEKEDIYSYSLDCELEKQNLIENERLKIELLTNYDHMTSLIPHYLGEKDEEQGEDFLNHLFDNTSFEGENRMANYFEKLVGGNIVPPPYQKDFSIDDLLSLKVGEVYHSSLLGNVKLLFRTEKEIVIDTKRGKIELLIN